MDTVELRIDLKSKSFDLKSHWCARLSSKTLSWHKAPGQVTKNTTNNGLV